ncbi:MAG: RsfS/YbeB/iojap family protein, partial [Pedosphaera parvula]|nr:RsfS/YbeB/iojap family protein [Pedosphaera parvula]
VLDYFDVIVHVMRADVRERFDLEGLWGDAPKVRPRKRKVPPNGTEPALPSSSS